MNAANLRRHEEALARTHCKGGHALVGENLRIRNTGIRLCVVCERARNRARRERGYRLATTPYDRQRHRNGKRKADAWLVAKQTPRPPREPIYPRRKRAAWTHTAFRVLALIRLHPLDLSLNMDAIEYRARYYFMDGFRDKEIHRARAKEFDREAASDGSLSIEALVTLFAAAHHCPYCGERMRSQDKSLDHIIPLSRGGVHGLSNACVCCLDCNRRKHARLLSELPSSFSQRVLR